MFIGYFVIGLCALGHFGVQGKLVVTFEDIEVEVIDPKYFNPDDVVFEIIDDDTITVGFTIIKTIPMRSQGQFLLFGLSMGEYVVPTGLDVQMTLCEMIVEPILMGPIFKSLGFAMGKCPVALGTYKMERYKLPVDNLPDEFEENKYQGKFKMTLDGKAIMSVKVLVDVMNEYDR